MERAYIYAAQPNLPEIQLVLGLVLLVAAVYSLTRATAREGVFCVPSRKQWTAMIKAAEGELGPILAAKRFYYTWKTLCKPALFSCDDDCEYVVKGSENGRTLINEHIVGVLGRAMGAPVAEVRVVHVSKELIDAEPEIQYMKSGVAHGSLLIPNTNEKIGIHYGNIRENRGRFSYLARLFGLIFARDIQFIYDKPRPHVVHSVDHGEFFPGWGHDWRPKYFKDAPEPAPHSAIVQSVGLTSDELRHAARAVGSLTDAVIARAVAGCRAEWGTTETDRIERAIYLASRRDAILSADAIAQGRG
jgi:hypothetical protein